MSYIGKNPNLDPRKIGELIPVNGNINLANSDYLMADGSDIVSANYPAISGSLNAATASTLRSLPNSVNFNCVGYGNGLWIAVTRAGPNGNYDSSSNAGFLFSYSQDGGSTWANKYIAFNSAFYTDASGASSFWPSKIRYLNGAWYLTVSSVDPGFNPPASATVTQHVGIILKSSDGYSWSMVHSSNDLGFLGTSPYSYSRLNTLKYINSKYFTVSGVLSSGSTGLYPRLSWSSNGDSWTNVAYLPADSTGMDIEYGAGVYVLVHGYPTNATYSSTDYTNWTSRTNTCLYGWTSIAYGAGCFVTVQGHYNQAYTVAGYSTDGITWSQKTIPSGRYQKVLYANSKFVAIGYNCCATSTDGQTWTARTVPNYNWYDMDYNATDGFVAVANNYNSTTPNIVIKSTNGETWTSVNINTGLSCGNVIYNTGNGFVATDKSTNKLLYSSDGLSWSVATTALPTAGSYIASNPTGSIYCQIYSNAASAIYYSTNPISGSWSQVKVAGSSYFLSGIKWLNDRFLCWGFQTNTTSVPLHIIYSSPTGQSNTWTTAAIDTSSNVNNASINIADITYGNGYYVGVGNYIALNVNNAAQLYEGKLSIVSTDGVYWEIATGMPFTAMWSAVQYGNGVFVALTTRTNHTAGLQGVVDADSFHSTTAGFSDAGGAGGRAGAVSTNGSDWVPMYLPAAASWNSLTFNGHVFIAIASDISKYAVSKDGFNWVLREANELSNWNSIASNTSTNTSIVVSGYGNSRVNNATPLSSYQFNKTGGTLRITESATSVTLPYVRPDEGLNYAVRVK